MYGKCRLLRKTDKNLKITVTPAFKICDVILDFYLSILGDDILHTLERLESMKPS